MAEKRNNRGEWGGVPAFSKIGMTGCPVSKKYGGLGLDMITYALAIEQIGMEGSSLYTFFSTHTSIGQMLLQLQE